MATVPFRYQAYQPEGPRASAEIRTDMPGNADMSGNVTVAM